MDDEPIVVVTGLPRSGTSMMMQMLSAGGIAPVTDAVRAADADNPRGYFEYERVKELARDASWLPEIRGRCVKVITALVEHLPSQHRYRVILMRRDIREVLQSQRAMLLRRGRPAEQAEDGRMADLFGKHLGKVEAFIANHPAMKLLPVDHRRALDAPSEVAAELNAFLGGRLDESAMARSVDEALHRHKA